LHLSFQPLSFSFCSLLVQILVLIIMTDQFLSENLLKFFFRISFE
jgi:hypothetical protein